jgi:hypothetical protein
MMICQHLLWPEYTYTSNTSIATVIFRGSGFEELVQID